MKPIHFHINDLSGPHIFFKPKANERATAYVVNCSNSENCSLFKIGQCVARKFSIGGQDCVYGRQSVYTGFSRRSKSFRNWISEQRIKYNGVGSLKCPTSKMAIIGDYVYLGYGFISINKDVPFFFGSGYHKGDNFIKLSDFTIPNIIKIVDFRPQAILGGEIREYQREEVPQFLSNLRENFEELYKELLKVYPRLIKTYSLDNINYVGRTALLLTVNPGTFTIKHKYEGKYDITWEWDGKVAKTKNIHAYQPTWGELKDGSVEITFTPSEITVVKISDNSQVGPQTKFTD